MPTPGPSTPAPSTPAPPHAVFTDPPHAAPTLPFRGDPAQPKDEAQQGRKVSPATGPTTPGGKAIASRNATTHGLFARDVVLTALGEDPAAYDALLTQLCEQLPPRNLLERHYLEQIAAASWRLRRLHRWQAQVYEDPTITEDERLGRLDKVLRHEVALTRQIDRAVRTLNRDLKWLFEGRARDEAFCQRDLTESEVRAEPELEIEVQRDIWRRLRPAPAPDLGQARLDNAPARDTSDAAASDANAQNCQNEPTPAPPDHPLAPAPLPPGEGTWPLADAGEKLPHAETAETNTLPGKGRGKAPEHGEKASRGGGGTPTPGGDRPRPTDPLQPPPHLL